MRIAPWVVLKVQAQLAVPWDLYAVQVVLGAPLDLAASTLRESFKVLCKFYSQRQKRWIYTQPIARGSAVLTARQSCPQSPDITRITTRCRRSPSCETSRGFCGHSCGITWDEGNTHSAVRSARIWQGLDAICFSFMLPWFSSILFYFPSSPFSSSCTLAPLIEIKCLERNGNDKDLRIRKSQWIFSLWT
jgi:hypothetical protein